MTYPLETNQQLSAVLRALRQSHRWTQAELGTRLGVNQKRIARIEARPGVTSFDQISRLVALMGHRLVLEPLPRAAAGAAAPAGGGPTAVPGDASW
jgi:HTH-type transcriptional regulator/antitoxin HipB